MTCPDCQRDGLCAFHKRLAEWTDRMNRDCHKHIPLPVTTDVPPPRSEPEKDREP